MKRRTIVSGIVLVGVAIVASAALASTGVKPRRLDLKPSGGVQAGSALRVAELDARTQRLAAGRGRRSGRVGDERRHRRVAPLRPRHLALRCPGAQRDAPGGSTVTIEDGQLFLLRPTS
jgi:hypothetical protein